MMFESLVKLMEAWELFLRGEPYSYLHSTSQLENFAEEEINSIQNLAVFEPADALRRR